MNDDGTTNGRDGYLRRALYWLDALPDEDLALAAVAVAALVQEAVRRPARPGDRPRLVALRAELAAMQPHAEA